MLSHWGGARPSNLGVSVSISSGEGDRTKAVASLITVKVKNGLTLNVPVMGFFSDSEGTGLER